MSEPRSDINQLLMQVKYNFQVLWRLVDYTEDIANYSFIIIIIIILFKQNSS